MTSYKLNLGQYFTKNDDLKQHVWNFVLNKAQLQNTPILEPSIGRGDLIEFFKERNPKQHFDMYEIDPSIQLLPGIDELRPSIKYEDFLQSNVNKKYVTIIGNPPYVRTKKGNLYLDFIKKCYGLLREKGELVFIVPSDFFKITSANKLVGHMMKHGHFTHVYHPHKENLFENASIDVLIFRYYKEILPDKVCQYNNQPMKILNNNGIVTFIDIEKNPNCHSLTLMQNTAMQNTVGNYFNVYVGMVSGKEKVFKNSEFGTLELLIKKNEKAKYILVKEFPTENEKLNNYLLENKKELIERKIKKMTEKNWFEWGALRNVKAIERHRNQPCIYMYNLTRQVEVAFAGKVDYFGGNLLMIVPKTNIDINIDLNQWVAYFNSDAFKKNYMYSNRFKIGQNQLCHAVAAITTLCK